MNKSRIFSPESAMADWELAPIFANVAADKPCDYLMYWYDGEKNGWVGCRLCASCAAHVAENYPVQMARRASTNTHCHVCDDGLSVFGIGSWVKS